MGFITDLQTASGKDYVINHHGFNPGDRQYIDRDYTFDYIPQIALGHSHILTAGNDKMIPEDSLCLSFNVGVPVTVLVVYADKLRTIPNWLCEYKDTREKVTRTDSNVSTLKGIFTLFAKDFEPGLVELNGNLSATMAEDSAFKASVGTNYCMYSVVVKKRAD